MARASRGCRALAPPVEPDVPDRAKGVESLADIDEAQLREKAEKRVKQKTHLLQGIGTYVVVNGFLVIIWALTGRGYPWFLWVMAGMGIALAFQVVGYFTGTRGEAAKDRMIQKEMERLKNEEGGS